MSGRSSYSKGDITRTYRKVHDHIDTSRHISRYSENPEDIRDVALGGLVLSGVKSALDLGCSYGFFTEKLAPRLSEDAQVTGIDLVDEGNSDSFLRIVEASGRRGRFLAGSATDLLKTLEYRSFGLVAASYSLYFFPHLIGEISKIIKPDGVFIAVTHTERSLDEIISLIPEAMQRTGIDVTGELAIRNLFRAFSMENGKEKLEKYFDRIETLVYPNKLIFPGALVDDCIDYLAKKRSLLFKEVMDEKPELLKDVMEAFFDEVRARARSAGYLEITKSDCVFRCYAPKG